MDNQEQRGGRRGNRGGGRGHHHNNEDRFYKHERDGDKYGNYRNANQPLTFNQPQDSQINQPIIPDQRVMNDQHSHYHRGQNRQRGQRGENRNVNQPSSFNQPLDSQIIPNPPGQYPQFQREINEQSSHYHRGQNRQRGENYHNRHYDRDERQNQNNRQDAGNVYRGGGFSYERGHHRKEGEGEKQYRHKDFGRQQGEEVFRSGHRRGQGYEERGHGANKFYNNQRDRQGGQQLSKQEKDQQFFLKVKNHLEKYATYASLTPENNQKLQNQLEHLQRIKDRTTDPNVIFLIDQYALQIRQMLSSKPIQNAQMRQEQLERKVEKKLAKCHDICAKFNQFGSMKDHNWNTLNEDKQFFEKHFATIGVQYQESVRQALVLMNDVLSLRVARQEASQIRIQQNQQRQQQQNQNKEAVQQPQQVQNAEQTLEDDDSKLCIVCISNSRTHLAVPCGHFMYCDPCSRQLKDCAFCRKQVQSFTKVFS